MDHDPPRFRRGLILGKFMPPTQGHRYLAGFAARLCDRLGFDPALTMAVGDSMNDIEMLKWAGVGVLMGHAGPEMRQYADVITGREPGHGVAEALDAIKG